MASKVISPIVPTVGRKKINGEQVPARFPDGTLKRIRASLLEKEKIADLIRDAVDRELKRREASRVLAKNRRHGQ